ncbi:MAG: thymidine phosphorylase, partial [Clostridiales bacterium]
TNRGQACHTAEKLLDGGEPFHKLQQMLAVQGGDSDFNHLPKANLVLPFCADEEGYITAIDTALVGYASLALGAGRTKAEEQIDYSAGIVFQHKCGAYLRQ